MRGVFTVAMGKPEFGTQAMALGRSLKLIGDQTHRIVYTDLKDYPWKECFHEVVHAENKWNSQIPLNALDYAECDELLILDVDMLAFKRLKPIFDYCQGKGFCVQGFRASSGTWWDQKISDLCQLVGVLEIPRFNGGLIYYERRPDVLDLLSAIRNKCDELSASEQFRNRHGQASTELSIMLASAKSDAFHLIPDHMNFQGSGSGPYVLPEVDVATNRCRFVSRLHRTEADRQA